MENKEFLEAIDAYLVGEASSWQTFIVEDHFESFKYNINILDFFGEEEVLAINRRIYKNIMEKLGLADSEDSQDSDEDE